MHFKDTWWTTSRQSSDQLWMVHKPDAKAVYAYNNREKPDDIYCEQWMLDYGDVCEQWRAQLQAGTLPTACKGTKEKAGKGFPVEDDATALFQRVISMCNRPKLAALCIMQLCCSCVTQISMN